MDDQRGPAPRHLRADYLVSPVGIDRPPLLTWQPPGAQSGYRLEMEAPGEGVTTASREDGFPGHEPAMDLRPASSYRWRVQTNEAGSWSRWSEWATFETALLSDADWLGARWIGSPFPGPAPVLAATIDAEGVSRPRLYVCGLGVAMITVNGEPVGAGAGGAAAMDPPPSAFDHLVWYRALDLTSHLKGEGNELEIRLGRGYYAMTTDTKFNWHIAPWRAEPKLRALVVDIDRPGEPLRVTDATWTARTTEVLDDSLYTGEVHDFGAPLHTGVAVVVDPPAGQLRSCLQPPVTRRERVRVVGRTWTGEDRQRLDLAANVAGVVTVRTDDESLPTLRIKAGEKLGAGGEVVAADQAVHGEMQQSELIRTPAGRPVALDLTYVGARYIDVTGSREETTVEVDRVSAAPRPVGRFWCSIDALNAIHEVTRATLENCLQAIPVDTPLYEKQGYTGDAQLLSEAYAYNYWMPTYLGSWLEGSILPTQSEGGSLPGITPTPPGNWIFDTPSPAWDAALFELPATLHRHYRDERSVRAALPALRRYLGYLARRYPDGIVTAGLGDWNPPGHNGAPPEQPPVVSTAYYIRFLDLMAHFLQIAGEPAEAATYVDRARAVRAAFNAELWVEDGWYASPGDGFYRETHNVMALAFGLVGPERRAVVLQRLLEGLHRRDLHLDTGIVGTRFLLPLLSRSGHADVAFAVACNESYPGWLYWLRSGATSLYENWELDGRSHNHAMFGTIDEWLYRDVAGLAPGAPGWRAVEVWPHVPAGDAYRCTASVDTLSGPVGVEWETAGDRLRGRVTAPVGVPVAVQAPMGWTLTSRADQPAGDLTEHRLELRLTAGQ